MDCHEMDAPPPPPSGSSDLGKCGPHGTPTENLNPNQKNEKHWWAPMLLPYSQSHAAWPCCPMWLSPGTRGRSTSTCQSCALRCHCPCDAAESRENQADDVHVAASEVSASSTHTIADSEQAIHVGEGIDHMTHNPTTIYVEIFVGILFREIVKSWLCKISAFLREERYAWAGGPQID